MTLSVTCKLQVGCHRKMNEKTSFFAHLLIPELLVACGFACHAYTLTTALLCCVLLCIPPTECCPRSRVVQVYSRDA